MARYSATAGESASAPETWPALSGLVRETDKPTLIVLVHPRCACSQATASELARLLARVPGRANAIVVFVKPPGVSDHEAWDNSDLRRTVEKIAGVHVVDDELGVEAGRFHAVTSGQTLLYGTDGELLFNGGLTTARGHEGDSAGKTALEALLGSDLASASVAKKMHTRVFGCGLFKKEGSS